MCGIFGYSGKKDAAKVVLEGLKRLEYRGYDSWGIAVVENQIHVNKKVGAIGDLDRVVPFPGSSTGIGHTRWATHGGISQVNAHPHLSDDKEFALAQNGIVENYSQLQSKLLKKGYKFHTDTDTEVIVRLIEDKLSAVKNLKEAVRLAFLELTGRNTIIVLDRAGQIIAARSGSPLVVGVSGEEIFFSSDTLSFAPFADRILVVDNGQLVFFDKTLQLIDAKSNKKLPYRMEKVNFQSSKVDKEGYDHFMLKEIFESPYAINQVVSQPQQEAKMYQSFIQSIRSSDTVYTIGSGTSGVAASQIAFYLRNFAGIKAVSLIGAEADEYLGLFGKNDLVIAPSQSGETADVLEVLEAVKKKGAKIASYVNMPGSTMTRISDYKFMIQAGPEICVMATKVFTAKLAWGYLISKMAAGEGDQARKNLSVLSDQVEKYLNTKTNHDNLKKIAKLLVQSKDIFLLGKYQNFNIIQEGMIKIIEGSYLHAHAIAAGDLKHYAITLMEKGVPVLAVVSEDKTKQDVLNAVSQVKARGAKVFGISTLPYEGFDYHIPVAETNETQAIFNTIPLQLLAYYMAVALGNNVDKPRNIAKSVTVK